MKKLLLSVIVGMLIFDCACAIPSPESRKNLCESRPLDFVWVEREQTCVPINPCVSADESILDAYCINTYLTIKSGENRESLIGRYVQNILNTDVADFVNITNRANFDGFVYTGARTGDGGYYVWKFGYGGSLTPEDTIASACWAYGTECIKQDNKSNDCYCRVDNYEQCQDIADFASLLIGDSVGGEIVNLGTTLCKITK